MKNKLKIKIKVNLHWWKRRLIKMIVVCARNTFITFVQTTHTSRSMQTYRPLERLDEDAELANRLEKHELMSTERTLNR